MARRANSVSGKLESTVGFTYGSGDWIYREETAATAMADGRPVRTVEVDLKTEQCGYYYSYWIED